MTDDDGLQATDEGALMRDGALVGIWYQEVLERAEPFVAAAWRDGHGRAASITAACPLETSGQAVTGRVEALLAGRPGFQAARPLSYAHMVRHAYKALGDDWDGVA